LCIVSLTWFDHRQQAIATHRAAKLRSLLTVLDCAKRPADMNAPGWRFHALSGDRKDSPLSPSAETGASFFGSMARTVNWSIAVFSLMLDSVQTS
jgi:hypothetical protein